MKKAIIYFSAVVISIIICNQTAFASTVLVSPASGNNVAGTEFSTTINLNSEGEKVCVVKGVLDFNNLTCKSITINSELMPQTIPSCSNPEFVLGIPGCTESDKNLLTVSTFGVSAGQAKLSLENIEIIGAGTMITSIVNNGLYNIVTVVDLPAAEQPDPQSVTSLEEIEGVSEEADPTTDDVDDVKVISEDENSLVDVAGRADLSLVPSGYQLIAYIILIILLGYLIYRYIIQKRK